MSFVYRVSLQVRHPTADPNDIIRRLDRRALRSCAVGEPRQASNGRALGGTYRETYCLFDIGRGEDGELADCLRDAVVELGAGKALFQELRATGGSVAFYVDWTPSGRGEVFDAALMSSIADLGIDLGIDPRNLAP